MSVITYKQLQDSWIRSDWVDSNVEDFGEDESMVLPESVYFGTVTVEDLLERNITTDNYFDIIRLADYIMITNVDPIVDKIVKVTGNVNVVYEFEQFYRLSKRLKPLDREQLRNQIDTFDELHDSIDLNDLQLKIFYMYGHSNFWDVSKIEDMSCMFYKSYFNGDISKWDVSNVTDMHAMFNNSRFSKDISNWDVSSVTNMSFMFRFSVFNNDLSKWNVSKVVNMDCMFADSLFNGDISKWNVSNVREMEFMFGQSCFDGDISNWNISNVTHTLHCLPYID